MVHNGKFFHLWFYVPVGHKEAVKDALFEAGAGSFGGYARCSWETVGKGQFLPMEGSSPAVGKPGSLEVVEEYRVEMRVSGEILEEVIDALRKAHPYEVPAYGVVLHAIPGSASGLE